MSITTLPDTSHEAYRSVTHKMLFNHHKKIILALTQLGSGMYEDIAIKTGLESHSVGRRLSELERMNVIYKPGEKKKTSTGRNAYVYKLVPTEEPATNQLLNQTSV